MKYDFETLRPRFGTGSGKWDEMEKMHPKLADKGEEIVPFSVADMEFVQAPEITEGLKNYLDTHVLGYYDPTDKYREIVCRWMRRRHCWDARPEWILPSHGVVAAFYSAIRCFSRKGDGVMLLTPSYYPMYQALRTTQRELVDCPLVRTMDSYRIDFKDFERKAADPGTKLFLLCSPHNPCGRVWTIQELQAMDQICRKHHVLVISDEIHHDLIMPGHTHTVFAAVSPEAAQNCVVLTAPSKTFNLAGLQTSNIFVPNPKLRETLWDFLRQDCMDPKCNILGYAACSIAYEQGEAWLDQCLQIIAENRNLIVEYFREHFPQIKVLSMEGTYLLWMDWRKMETDYRRMEEINRQKALLFFDEGYMFGKAGEGYERWNLACPSRIIRKALARMEQTWKPILSGK